MSHPSTIIKYMFDIRQLDDSSGTITPAPGPAPGSGRQAISTVGPAADPGPPGAALPLERLEAQICELAGHLAATPARISPCSESRPGEDHPLEDVRILQAEQHLSVATRAGCYW